MTREQANIALVQLTGRHNPMNTLAAMIGAKNFVVGSLGVSFRFKMCRKANGCRIELDEGLDLYNLVFLKCSPKRGYNEVKVINGVYCDQLKPIFEEFTGLRVTL